MLKHICFSVFNVNPSIFVDLVHNFYYCGMIAMRRDNYLKITKLCSAINYRHFITKMLVQICVLIKRHCKNTNNADQ